ncbi:MAG TPA: hypothetical protein VG144_07845, partial [Gaiellaceae bacterium]|nr:hypothetical protein [Gaiellaceae bacterium]
AGRDPDEVTCVYNLEARVDENDDDDPSVVAGPPGLIVERLRAFIGIGFSAFNFVLAGADADEQAERLARNVIPALRGNPSP